MPAKTIYTGARCGCKRGVERDNCPACEGTGRVIDFAAIRALTKAAMATTAPEEPPKEEPKAEAPAPDLYRQLVAIGCELDNHESDLYVRATPDAQALVRASGRSFKFFRSEVDGKTWIEVPFAFLPWWERRLGKVQP